MMPRVGGGGRPSASGDRPRSQQDAMFAQAQTLESQGHFIEAGNLFNQLALGERARDCFKEAGDWRSVAESWRGEEKHYPAGILFFALGDVDDALRELIRVPDDDLDCLPARRVVAILYGLIEQYGDSRTYFDASFSDTVGAPDVEALYYYGQVLEAESHTWPDALSIYETVLELSPGYRDTVQRFEALERGQPRRPTSIYDDAQNDSNSLFYALQEDVMSR
jgi:tetratricopeptide (TPR) repeat protein